MRFLKWIKEAVKDIMWPEASHKPDSVRAQEWDIFVPRVRYHIDHYTVPQYGDFPNDPVTNFTIADYKTNMLRYCNRIGTGMRGKAEEQRDCLKLAHYACMLYFKYTRGEK